MDAMLRAAFYIRVSTEDQTEFSPAAQEKALRTFAEKNHFAISDEHIYSDEGKSGKKADKRPAFMKMIGVAKQKPKPFDLILVHKLDRFARSRQDSVVYKNMLRKDLGIQVISITEPLDPDDKITIIVEPILEAMAEYYSINLAQEVKKGMTEKARRGECQTSPPLGYEAVNGKWKIHQEEANHIKYIFDQFVNQNQSPFQIARKLNELGIKSKRGNKMELRSVEYILQNVSYIGMLRWTPTEKAKRNFKHPDTILVENCHCAIISVELFEAAQKKYEGLVKKRKPRARPTTECKSWLSGLVKCSNCQSSLTLQAKLKSPSFQCSGYSHGKCLVSHSISLQKLEGGVISEIVGALSLAEHTEFVPNKTKTEVSELFLFEKQLTKIMQKQERAKTAYLNEVDTLDEYKANRRKFEEERIRILEQIQNSKKQNIAEFPSALQTKLNQGIDILTSELDLDLKQKAIRSIIDKIVYDKANETIEVYYFGL